MRLDEGYMRQALELARATAGLSSPNPQVGCVLVRDGEAVGQGAHVYEARDHAEIIALKTAGERARGATAYVTLEPCSHHGRTGPCSEALIRAGVRRVVTATIDPNPLVSGQGVERLRNAGVDVAVGVCEAEARTLNNPFARWVRTGRPWVTLKAAVSADGMIAPAVSVPGKIHWVTGVESRADVQRLRHQSDAVLTGIGTVLADDPLLTDRSGMARRRPLLRIVLDTRLRIPLEGQPVKSAREDVVVFCGMDADAGRVSALEVAGVEVLQIAAANGRLDLGSVLDVLGERKILSVLLECGSELNGVFLQQELVDEVVMFSSRNKLGDGAVPFAAGVSIADIESAMMRVERVKFGDDERVRGILRDAWKGIG
jgi:diaminohydroxyphosphoribosylaminopyrimidine deaminase/5-amino-6-(5-phosphoribosylamino)uracil reductase